MYIFNFDLSLSARSRPKRVALRVQQNDRSLRSSFPTKQVVVWDHWGRFGTPLSIMRSGSCQSPRERLGFFSG